MWNENIDFLYHCDIKIITMVDCKNIDETIDLCNGPRVNNNLLYNNVYTTSKSIEIL